MNAVDLNCDLGEGAGHDAELMPLITSANIACGAHAGDEAMMHATVALAKRHGVAVGAHPGFADRDRFGRRELALGEEAIYRLVMDQVLHFKEIAVEAKVPFVHVKPHGALYTLAAKDVRVARAIAGAIRQTDARLVLYGPAGSELVRAGSEAGLRVAHEVFADRAYGPDGMLLPRSQPGAVLANEELMIGQVLSMLQRGVVHAADGREIALQADTLCLHGDGPHAVAFARRIRQVLADSGIEARRFA